MTKIRTLLAKAADVWHSLLIHSPFFHSVLHKHGKDDG